ncbi:MAG: abortive phage infection protein [Lactimicrobium sp.]|jgi:predicted transcriptional regulator of viral defense system|uniref:type IV toxin-antitoxin system AbiEi family antitoxin domain-containing protein n=1 Tax=Lactimicrobium sp. TaxID=2563780 RepID=UPI002F35F8DE
MKSIEQLVDSSGIILTRNALESGISKHDLYSFLKQNSFEKAAQGIYVSPAAWADDLYVLSLRCPKGVISHDEALYHYGLIDREPSQRTMTVYTGYSTSRLVKDGVKLFTVKKELLNLGKIIVPTSFGHEIPMYDIDRTICDLIRNRNWFEIQDYQTALQSYTRNQNKDLYKLMKYAKAFHVDAKVREYMEVML